jgi:hypothetical protein
VTTISPSARPCEITAWSPIAAETTTLRAETVQLVGSTTHTWAPSGRLTTAESGSCGRPSSAAVSISTEAESPSQTASSASAMLMRAA